MPMDYNPRNPELYRKKSGESLEDYRARIERLEGLPKGGYLEGGEGPLLLNFEGGAGKPPRGTPPVATSGYSEQDPESSALIAAIQEILDNDSWSHARKLREIHFLMIGIRRSR